MSEPTIEQQLESSRAELARLRAGLAAGLTPEQSKFLRGSTSEELQADARTLAVAFGTSTARPPSASGSDVQGHAAGSLGAGAARYQREHGLDENGQRPQDARPPFHTTNYHMENH
ncbi:hypothetical protein [Streptomyces fuscichromogenes]|uniref:Uncharacterized protein n=1 Tax=Streptomyces fuscichromogenes TaxID=1324013 RepID=A0A918CWI2_9ACTN|nr:hypothetical protein [Streptomyces fuscichromogenes]GGN38153.1 hypothetical protein GCM10011578_083230 [Streptomyces fuscichromogenes]